MSDNRQPDDNKKAETDDQRIARQKLARSLYKSSMASLRKTTRDWFLFEAAGRTRYEWILLSGTVLLFASLGAGGLLSIFHDQLDSGRYEFLFDSVLVVSAFSMALIVIPRLAIGNQSLAEQIDDLEDPTVKAKLLELGIDPDKRPASPFTWRSLLIFLTGCVLGLGVVKLIQPEYPTMSWQSPSFYAFTVVIILSAILAKLCEQKDSEK